MIITLFEAAMHISYREAIIYNIVRGLDVEGLFDFGIGSYEEVEKNEGRDEKGEEEIWRIISTDPHCAVINHGGPTHQQASSWGF